MYQCSLRERNMPHKYGTKIPHSYFTKTQLLPGKPQKKGELNNFVQLCYRECKFPTTFLCKEFFSIYDNRGSWRHFNRMDSFNGNPISRVAKRWHWIMKIWTHQFGNHELLVSTTNSTHCICCVILWPYVNIMTYSLVLHLCNFTL